MEQQKANAYEANISLNDTPDEILIAEIEHRGYEVFKWDDTYWDDASLEPDSGDKVTDGLITGLIPFKPPPD